MRVLALVIAIFAVGGCLEVDALDGTLICSDVKGRECPHGYYCAPNNSCWKDGHVYSDMAIVHDMAVKPFMPADLSGLDLAQPTD